MLITVLTGIIGGVVGVVILDIDPIKAVILSVVVFAGAFVDGYLKGTKRSK